MESDMNPLHALSALALEHQGTKTGRQIKAMYFRVLQAQLHDIKSDVKAFDNQETLDMIYSGKMKEGDFDHKSGVIRLFAYGVEHYFDRNSKEYLEIFRGKTSTKAVRKVFDKNGKPGYKYYIDEQRRREKQYQRTIVR